MPEEREDIKAIPDALPVHEAEMPDFTAPIRKKPNKLAHYAGKAAMATAGLLTAAGGAYELGEWRGADAAASKQLSDEAMAVIPNPGGFGEELRVIVSIPKDRQDIAFIRYEVVGNDASGMPVQPFWTKPEAIELPGVEVVHAPGKGAMIISTPAGPAQNIAEKEAETIQTALAGGMSLQDALGKEAYTTLYNPLTEPRHPGVDIKLEGNGPAGIERINAGPVKTR